MATSLVVALETAVSRALWQQTYKESPILALPCSPGVRHRFLLRQPLPKSTGKQELKNPLKSCTEGMGQLEASGRQTSSVS